MRILVLSNVPPGAVGGAEMQALHLARRWTSAGHRVMVAGHANDSGLEDGVRIIRIPTFQASRLTRGASYLASTLRLLWTHRREFDLVYCRFMKEQAIAACFARALFRMHQPIVACPAASGHWGDVGLISRSPIRVPLLRLLDEHLACINAMTSRIEAEIREIGLSGPRISNIPNGVAIRVDVVHRTPEDPILRAIFVGRLVEQKGVDILLQALSRLRFSGQDLALEIIGDGPERSALQKMTASLGLENRVYFRGQLAPETVHERRIGADFFVLPSRFEGLPGALLEAFGDALPAVVTRVSGSEDVVDAETGWIVPPEDPKALAAALSSAIALGRHGLQQMGAAAREKALRQYDMEFVAARYEKLFRELLQPKTL
jgi:glycosyltransferase involved in cell wall biosynthesis